MTDRMKKAILLLMVCAIMGFIAWYVMNWSSWVQGWVGVQFKMIGGAVLGWIVSRHFLRVDPSKIDDPIQRGFAGLSIAIVVGLFALGAALGV